MTKRIGKQRRPGAFALSLLLVTAGGLGLADRADAAVPQLVTFSGRLSDGTGWGQSATVSQLDVTLHDAQTGGTALWRQTYTNVPVDDGYFAVTLSDGTDLATDQPANVTAVFAVRDQAWVGISIEGFAETSPRQRVGSVPYAVRAGRADVATSLDGVRATTAAVDYYVSETGDDQTGDGSQASPWQTLQHAIDQVPQIINHTVTIHLEPGVYPGGAVISGLMGRGELLVLGDAASPSSVRIQFDNQAYGITVSKCPAQVRIQGIQFEKVVNTGKYAVFANTSAQVRIDSCIFEGRAHVGDTAGGGVLYSYSRGSVGSSAFNNCHIAANPMYSSAVSIFGNTGSGNNAVLYVSAGATVGEWGNSIGTSVSGWLYQCPSGSIFSDSGMVCPCPGVVCP